MLISIRKWVNRTFSLKFHLPYVSIGTVFAQNKLAQCDDENANSRETASEMN
jgi:hypothetical protein